MPTGYTALIEDGKVKTVKDYLHACLRNFGICWCLRDSDVPMEEGDLEPYIKEAFQKDIDYHRKQLETAKQKLAEFNALSEEDLYRRYERETTEKYDRYNELYVESLKKNELYDKFLTVLQGWSPSEDFQNIKKFAIQQIETSKDSNPAYWGNEAEKVGLPTREKFEEMKDTIKSDMCKSINWDIDYHQEEMDKRTKGLESALDFYRRFKEEVETLEDLA